MFLEWSSEARALWAKTGPEYDWLHLPRHMMDSAAVGELLWDTWAAPGIRSRLVKNLGLDSVEDGRKFMGWLAGVHDVGKCTPMFQGQLRHASGREDYIHRVLDAGLPLRNTSQHDWYPHATGSEVVLEHWLVQHIDHATKPKAAHIAAIAGAHHGLPSSTGYVRACHAEFSEMDPHWLTVQHELVDGITEYTSSREVLTTVVGQRVNRADQMILTGLVIMADWIASNQDYFPLSPSEDTDSRERAAIAMEHLALTDPVEWPGLPDNPNAAYVHRFDWPPAWQAKSAQRVALEAAAALDGPGLVCLEAPMGSGKTEAALLVAETLAERTGRGGVLFAAPTMATSDALLTRIKSWADSVVGQDCPQVISLYLGHSRQALNEDMRELRRQSRSIRSIGLDESNDDGGSVIAHQWLSGRKLGMLANIVVGTVDQVLFLALQSKHAMLRHLGLANKVIVIDEAHSYDAYMNAYLQRALEWLGAYNVPVVLLSATLPHSVKAPLIAAYAQGLHQTQVSTDIIPSTGHDYPVVTVANQQEVTSHKVEPPPTQHHATVEYLPDDLAALSDIMHKVCEHGGTLLVLCNTVGRAQEAYSLAVALAGEDARLLHSRFIAADRIRLERELVQTLGPPTASGAARPERSIVVATQVAEQSLDVDFDAIVTDIAPMDLVLQRLGRVHRHNRPAEHRPDWAKTPRLWVRGIEDPGSDTHPPVFEAVQEIIYARVLLLKTWALLRQRLETPGIEMPQDIPKLVQAAYEDDSYVPDVWNAELTNATEELSVAQTDAHSRAKSFMFPAPPQARRFQALWASQSADIGADGVSEAQGLAQVRDTEPTLEVLVTQKTSSGYRPLPWVAETDAVLAPNIPPPELHALTIASSSLRLPYSFSYPQVFQQALDELEEHTDPGWQQSYVLKGQLQLMLDEQLRTTLAGKSLRYDRTLGLLEEPTEQ